MKKYPYTKALRNPKQFEKDLKQLKIALNVMKPYGFVTYMWAIKFFIENKDNYKT